jgi:peptide chain release factor subunit 1
MSSVAGTITLEVLRDLAAFRAERGSAISLYLNLDPAVAATQPDVAARVSALLADAERRADEIRETLTREQREGVKSDLERIHRWFDEEFDRDGSHGAVVFADGPDTLWRPQTLIVAPPDRVHFGHRLYLAPLAGVVGDGDGAFVAYVGRERADVFRLSGGRLVEIADRTEDVPGRHDQGGWSQARYERHIENIVEHHLRRLAETIDECVRRAHGRPLVLVGADEIRSEFEDLLANESRVALVGWTTAERHASASELLAAAKPLLRQWRERRQRELLERWQEEAARDGRASAGWRDTLLAASDARVDVLLVNNGATQPAFSCPVDGRSQLDGGTCPLDGTPLEPGDGLDLVLRQTLIHGGRVEVIRTRRDLNPVEGIGALLRF